MQILALRSLRHAGISSNCYETAERIWGFVRETILPCLGPRLINCTAVVLRWGWARYGGTWLGKNCV